VLEGEGEDELDNNLKPDHKFFAVRSLVEGGKTARKLNRRLKVAASTDEGFLVKGDERYFRIRIRLRYRQKEVIVMIVDGKSDPV
jgi:hypothetical protein